MKVYPLDGDSDLLHVCWSKKQQASNGERWAITHIVASNGQRTLCGKSLVDFSYIHPLAGWDFEIWSRKHDRGWGVEEIGCRNCRKSKKLTEI